MLMMLTGIGKNNIDNLKIKQYNINQIIRRKIMAYFEIIEYNPNPNISFGTIDEVGDRVIWVTAENETQVRDFMRDNYPEISIDVLKPMSITPVIDIDHFIYWFENIYQHCEEEWTEGWWCQCNIRCPVCNVEIEPINS